MAAPGSCLLTLTFKDTSAGSSDAESASTDNGQQPNKKQMHERLQVDRALLWHASPVLRGAIEATCCGGSGSGPDAAATTLALVGDDPAHWEAVLQLLQHTAPAVTWGNLAALMRLADKYDMSPLRTACAAFLAAKTGDMSLTWELDKPLNTLHAASLLERYTGYGSGGSGGGQPAPFSQPDLEPYIAAINAVLDAALRPLLVLRVHRDFSGGYGPGHSCIKMESDAKAAACTVAEQLTSLMQHPAYRNIVSEGLQARVTASLLACLKTVLIA